jgi:hypothetical protein
MIDTVELTAFKGVRNDISLERFAPDDLSAAVNVDLDETGKIMRRLGSSQVAAGAAHSLFCGGGSAYVVVNGILNELLPDMSTVAIAPVSSRVAYATVYGTTFWSDGAQTGSLVSATNTPWGIVPPPALSMSNVAGGLRPGRYLAAMTYVRATGEESGAVGYTEIDVGTNEGILFGSLPVSTDPQVTTKRIYVTTCNGAVALETMLLDNDTTSAVLADMPVQGAQISTQFMGPPPAGQVVKYFSGRALIGSGNFLHYTEPHKYGLVDRRFGSVGFDSDVRTIAPVNDGVFVGTATANYWLAGNDPTTWQVSKIATYGAVLGTEVVLRNDLVGQEGVNGSAIAWMTTRGLAMGFDGGTIQDKTGARYIPPVAREGASLFKIRGGTPQIITTLYN